MNIEIINADIKLLHHAANLVAKTKNSIHFNKAGCMLAILSEIQSLKIKRDAQLRYLQTLKESEQKFLLNSEDIHLIEKALISLTTKSNSETIEKIDELLEYFHKQILES